MAHVCISTANLARNARRARQKNTPPLSFFFLEKRKKKIKESRTERLVTGVDDSLGFSRMQRRPVRKGLTIFG